MRRRDARSGVGDRDLDVLALLQRVRQVLGGSSHVLRRDLEVPATRHRLTRVEYDVLDHLTDLSLVSLNLSQVRGGGKAVVAARATQCEPNRALENGAQVNGPHDRRASLGESQKLPGEAHRG